MTKRYFLGIFLVIFTVMLSSFTFYSWQVVYSPNILVGKDEAYFAIRPGATFDDVRNDLYRLGYLLEPISFSFLAKIKKYPDLVKPGMYLLKPDMSNVQVINKLRSGAQDPITVTFTNARKLNEVAERIASYMAADEKDFVDFFQHDTVAAYYGFNSYTFIAMFLPDTYEMYWTATPKEVADKMKRIYDQFWTGERKEKALRLGLTPVQVATLASIVENETNKMDEAPIVAGVYINRIKRGMKLQADPTLVYAVGDFTIKRVLNVHKEVDSPYNTYIYAGLPPGPISLPSKAAINAVLNYQEHSYLYFCAKDDFSGYHAFAKTLVEHNENARKFQQALDRNKIYR